MCCCTGSARACRSRPGRPRRAVRERSIPDTRRHPGRRRLLDPQAQLLARTVLQESLTLELDDALSLATERWMTLMGSAQRVEGHKAFIEKRVADWSAG